MNKATAYGRVTLHLMIVMVCVALAGVAFTVAPGGDAGMVGHGERVEEDQADTLAVWHNGVRRAGVFFLGENAVWVQVDRVPVVAADGSNQLKLYDVGSPLLPAGVSLQNVAGRGELAGNGGWLAGVDVQGGVWIGGGFADEFDPVEVEGLPPVDTLALGSGHAVALAQGEVWVWGLAPGIHPGIAAPPVVPVRLEVSGVVAVGAWREFGFAKSGDGAIWLWQGSGDGDAAFAEEAFAEEIGVLMGDVLPQEGAAGVSGVSSPAVSATPMHHAAAVMQTTGASVPLALPSEGLRLWLKADAGVVADDSGKVSQWLDQSGAGIHASQSVLARRPVVVASSTLAGQPAIRFDAAQSQQLGLANFMNGAAAGEVFAVLKAVSAVPSAMRGLWRLGYSNSSRYPNTNGTLNEDFGSNAGRSLGVPAADIAQWHVYNVSAAAGEWVARVNGVQQHRATSNTVFWNATPLLGHNGSYGFDGEIAEVLVFDRVLTGFERTTVQEYLAGRHRLAGADEALPVPSNLSAHALSSGQVSLQWNATAAAWISYEVQRKTGNGAYVTVATANGLSHVDGTLSAGTEYTFRVRALSATAVSTWSNEIIVQTPASDDAAIPLENLRLWLKADALPVGVFHGWRDQSGNNNSAIPPNAAARPEVVVDAATNLAAVRFNAVQQLGLANFMSGAAAGEAFVVLKAASSAPSAVRGLWRLGYSNSSRYPNTNGTLNEDFGSNAGRSLGVPAADIAQWHVYNVSAAAGEWVARVNGVQQHRATSNTVSWNATPLFGHNGSYGFDGDIAEVLIFDKVLTDAERTTVGRYLRFWRELPGVVAPAVPPVLSGQVVGGGQVYLSWEAPVESAWTEYVIERSEDGLAWETAGRVGMGRRNYLGQNIPVGAGHYRLRTRNWAGESGWSNTIVLTVAQGSAATVPVEGLRLWLRSDAGVVADASGGVECWTDVSGAGNHAVQFVAASRPALAAASTDARPVVRFTRGTAQKLELPASLMTGATAGDAFVILRANASRPASHSGLWRVGAAVGYYPQTSGVLMDGFGSNVARDLSAAQADITSRHLLELTAAAGNWQARLNGFEQTRADSNTVGWHATPLLGHNGSYAFDGDVEEVLIYDCVLDDAGREQVRRHLNARHSLAGGVPEAPGGLQVRPGVQGGVELFWPAPAVAPVTQIEYIIERSANGGAFEEIARTAWRSYTDADAVPGNTYTYRIKARNGAGDSAPVTAVPLFLDATAALPGMPARENLLLWLRADQGVLTDGTPGNAILRWQDQSGNGNHASQLAVANRPVLATNAISGEAAVRFTAAQKHTLSFLNVMQGAVAAEIIIRVKASAITYSADNGLWKWSASGAAYPGRTGTLTDGTASNANQLQGIPVLSLDQWRTYAISAAAGQWISRIDGVEQYRAAANTVAFVSAPLLGTNGSAWFDGDIAEILIYDRTLGTAEREQLTRYLDARAHPGSAPDAPEVPAGLTATAESASTIAVRWTPPAGADESLTYILERCIGDAGAFEEILWTTNGYATRSDYTDRGHAPGTVCAYRMKARNSAGIESAYSNPVSATTHEDTAADSLWPADIAPDSLRLWLRADLGLVQGPEGNLVTWEDQSGKNNHAIQSQVASQPFAGAGSVVFDATKSQVLTLPQPLFTGAVAGDIFVVLKTTPSTPVASRGLWQLGPGSSYYLQSTNAIVEGMGTNVTRDLGQPLADTTEWHLYNVTTRAGEWVARLNGLEQYRDAAANTVAFTSAPKLGMGGGYFHGEIAEVILFDRVLTDAERERLACYLNSRHAVLSVSAAAPAVPENLDATADTPGGAHVTWTLPSVPALGVTYTLERQLGASGAFEPVFNFAQGNAMHRDYADNAVAVGQSYTYRFRARDAMGRETIGASSVPVVIPAVAAPGVFAQTDGLRLWLRADRGVVLAASGNLAAWRDQSGNGNHARQLNPTAQPSPASGAVLFSGAPAGRHFSLPGTLMSGAASGEAFVVLKSGTVASAVRGLWRLGFSSLSNYPGTTGALVEDFGSNAQRALGTPKADIALKHLYHVTAAPGEWVARLNDIEQFRAAANTVSWNNAPLLGGNGSAGFDGEISEILIYDHVLDDAARAAVCAYLDTRHTLGIAAPPPAPVLSVREVLPVGVELTWTFSTPETDARFILERSDDGGAFTSLATLGRHDRAFTDGAVQAGHVYAYRIKLAATTAGDGAWSNTATVTVTVVPAPAVLAGGLRLWLRAGQQLTVSGEGRIARWADQSGLGNHATQASAATMPRLCEDGTVAFAAAQNRQFTLPPALMGNATAGEIFILLKADNAAPAATRGLWRMGGVSYSYYPNANGVVADDAGTTTSRTVGVPDADITGWHLYNVSSQPGEWTARFNGRERVTFGANTVRWATSPLLGSNGSTGFDGNIAEVLVYDRVLSEAERETVAGYLARKHIPGAATPPDSPSQLSVRVIGAGQIFLEWQSTSAPWATLELQRKIGDGAYATIARPEGTAHVDDGLEPGQTFTYRLRVNNPAGDGAWSNTATVTLPGEMGSVPVAIPLASLRLWLKGDTLAPGGVAFWRDQSGNGNHATASAAGTRPQVVPVPTGIQTVRFAAAQAQQLNLPNLMNGVTEGEAFVVLKAVSATPSALRGLWRMGSSGISYYPNTTGVLTDSFGMGSSRSLGAPAADVTQWHVYNVSSKAGEWVARLNGMQQFRATSNTVTWSTVPLLGHNGSYGFDGEIAEVLIFDKVLTHTERVTVQDYLSGRHRLAGADEILPAPANLNVQALSPEQVSLQWDAAVTAWISYEVQRKTGDGPYATVATTSGLSCVDAALSADTEYTFRVRARSATAASAWSNEVTVQTLASGGAGIPLENLRLWLKADTLSVGALNGWPDQSGNNNTATAPSNAVRPEVITDAATNRHVVRFNATQAQQLNLPNLMNGADEGEAFVVLKAASAAPSAPRGLWRMSSLGTSYYPNTTGVLTDSFGTGSNRSLGVPVADIAQWHVYNVSSKAGEWVSRLNGIQQFRATSTTVTWSPAPLLGHNGSYGFDGDIVEVLIFDKVLSDAERNGIGNYFLTRYPMVGGETPYPDIELTAELKTQRRINLSWTASFFPWVEYVVERKTSDGVWERIGRQSQKSFSDTDVFLGQTYSYRVKAVNILWESNYSNEVSVIIPDHENVFVPVFGKSIGSGDNGVLFIDPSAEVEYVFSTDVTGVYQYQFSTFPVMTSGVNASAQLDVWVNDKFVGRHVANSSGEGQLFEGLFCLEKTGIQDVRIRQTSSSLQYTVRLEQFSIVPVMVEDMDESALDSLRAGVGMDTQGLIHSKVSPYCIEGNEWVSGDLSLFVDGEQTSALPQLEGRWYADIPLEDDEEVFVEAHFGQGMFTDGCFIAWETTNVFGNEPLPLLRRDDSLLFVAQPEGLSGEFSVEWEIRQPSGAINTYSVQGAVPQKYKFKNSGKYAIKAVVTGENGVSLTQTVEIHVVSVAFGPEPIVPFDTSIAKKTVQVGHGPIVLSWDTGLSVSPANLTTSNNTLSVSSSRTTPAHIVARTAEGGAILGVIPVEVTQPLLRPSDWGGVPVMMTLPNGDMLIKITLVCGMFPDGWYVDASMYAHQTYFLDGSQTMRFYKSDFRGEGLLDIYILKKKGDSGGVCHYITIYDDEGRAVKSW